jgi:hypothetical protein
VGSPHFSSIVVTLAGLRMAEKGWLRLFIGYFCGMQPLGEESAFFQAPHMRDGLKHGRAVRPNAVKQSW